MSDQFNPYYKWLGIPQEELPPNHYRLLGITPFEANADVILAAADQRMTFLKTFQVGPHGKLSQQLLNEVAAAKTCLLSAKKKAAYDEQLRQQLAARQEDQRPRRTDVVPPPVAQSAPDVDFALLVGTGSKAKSGSYVPKKKRTKSFATMVPWIVFGIAGSLIGLAALAVVFLQSGGNDRVTGKSGETHTPVPQVPTLVLNWPEKERVEAQVLVDDKRVKVPEKGKVEIPLPQRPEIYKIELKRPGYEKVSLRRFSRPGEPIEDEVVLWKPINQEPVKSFDPAPSLQPQPVPAIVIDAADLVRLLHNRPPRKTGTSNRRSPRANQHLQAAGHYRHADHLAARVSRSPAGPARGNDPRRVPGKIRAGAI